MSITKRELEVFKQIALNTQITSKELAEKTTTSQSYISTILSKMQKRGLIKKVKIGLHIHPKIAETPHATSLREIVLNNPNSNLDYITNKGISIISVLTCQNIKSVEELVESSRVSYATTWKYLDKAQGIGLVEKGNGIRINQRYEHVRKFAESYTRYINETHVRKYADDALIKWSCAAEYIFETQENLNIQRTGISAFHDYGALFLTLRTLYTSSEKILNIEDHLINHILSEGIENLLPLLITWRLNQENINHQYMKKRANRFKVLDITDAVQRYLDTKGKDKPDYIINWTEFKEKYREYSDE